jgi:hypothetical protein
MKAKKALPKYEVRCEAFIFSEKNETFMEIQSKSKTPSSKYEAKENFIEI